MKSDWRLCPVFSQYVNSRYASPDFLLFVGSFSDEADSDKPNADAAVAWGGGCHRGRSGLVSSSCLAAWSEALTNMVTPDLRGVGIRMTGHCERRSALLLGPVRSLFRITLT